MWKWLLIAGGILALICIIGFIAFSTMACIIVGKRSEEVNHSEQRTDY